MHPDVADYIGCYRILKRCLDVDPCHLDGLCTFAVFLADMAGERDEALRTYDKVLHIDPTNFVALSGKASLLAENCAEDPEADTSQVKKLYTDIVRRYPESAEALIGLGCFERRVLGAMNDAKRSFQRALAQDPSNVQALFNLGSIAHHEGDTKSAQQVSLFSFYAACMRGIWILQCARLLSEHEHRCTRKSWPSSRQMPTPLAIWDSSGWKATTRRQQRRFGPASCGALAVLVLLMFTRFICAKMSCRARRNRILPAPL